MSASAKTTLGLLPPSSRLIFFTLLAASRMISWPVVVSPVNATLPMPGWAAIAAPAVPPGPVTTLTTPGGKPASRASSPRRRADIGELLRVLLAQRGELRERAPALARGPARPAFRGVECRLRGLDGLVDVRLAAERRGRDRRAGRGVDELESLPIGGIDGLAADDHAQRGDIGAGTAG